MILGIDEVGRGPWAGPLVVGAVVLDPEKPIEGLTDSKKLTAKRREALDREIHEKALAYGLGWVHADELDTLGLSAALREATKRAVSQIKAPHHEIIIDGTINFLMGTSKEAYVTLLAKADLLIPAVSAASIIAKVARDTYMAQQAEIYPEYGFASHVGYGTAKHMQALHEYGITPLHRTSFAPIKKILGESQLVEVSTHQKITTKNTGDTGENIAAQYLESKGFIITERNWRTKWCEIDIVAQKQDTTYFVEVKYRKTDTFGAAVDAITPQKLRQMTMAAQMYMLAKKLHNQHVQLASICIDNLEVVFRELSEGTHN